jgi:hypothetical protein
LSWDSWYPLGRHEQIVQLVLVAVLLEILRQRQELLSLGLRGGALHELRAREITLRHHVAERRPDAVLRDERVELRRE